MADIVTILKNALHNTLMKEQRVVPTKISLITVCVHLINPSWVAVSGMDLVMLAGHLIGTAKCQDVDDPD